MKLKRFLLVLFCVLLSCGINAESTFTYRSPESTRDWRYDYDNAILKLALDKTIESYGRYRLIPSPEMNFKRALAYAKRGLLENFFFKQSYSDEIAQELAFIPFPVDLGIVGYRVCFVSKSLKSKVATVQTLNDLRRFSMGLGTGWNDVEILRYHGFRVIEVNSYESLFKFVAINRVDLFCRGTNELLGEYQTHKNIETLDYDRSIALAYPLPRFFFTNKANTEAIKRVTEGLQMAYSDGSLHKLWKQYYQPSIDFVKLEKRKIITIDNPFLQSLDPGYQKYFYKPFE